MRRPIPPGRSSSPPRRKNVPRREAQRELTPPGDLAILEEDERYL
jgi:hypothetical protein